LIAIIISKKFSKSFSCYHFDQACNGSKCTLFFCMHMQSLKQKCKFGAILNYQQIFGFQQNHQVLSMMTFVMNSKDVMLSWLPYGWYITAYHWLSCQGKHILLRSQNSFELSNAANGAFLICGYLNPKYISQEIKNWNAEHPHDPVYNIISGDCQWNKIPSVVLFIPFTGSFYSPRFLSDTTHSQAKGLWLHKCHLATTTILKCCHPHHYI